MHCPLREPSLVRRGSVINNREPHQNLLRSEKPPRMACVHARYSRKPIHDHSGECPCPTDCPYRAHCESSTATAASPWTACLLLGEALYEGFGDHDPQKAA